MLANSVIVSELLLVVACERIGIKTQRQRRSAATTSLVPMNLLHERQCDYTTSHPPQKLGIVGAMRFVSAGSRSLVLHGCLPCESDLEKALPPEKPPAGQVVTFFFVHDFPLCGDFLSFKFFRYLFIEDRNLIWYG